MTYGITPLHLQMAKIMTRKMNFFKMINKSLLYLVSLRTYSAEINSFVLALSHLKCEQSSWFDVAFMCSEEKIDVGAYELTLQCKVYCLKTPPDSGVWEKLRSANDLIQEYSHICLCTADDIWSFPKRVWEQQEEWGDRKVLTFNFLCAQPIEPRRFLAWNGYQQLQHAGKFSDTSERLGSLASEGPVSVWSIYESTYLRDLITAIQLARMELLGCNAAYENLIEDFVNIANLATGIACPNGLWALRYMNSTYAPSSTWMLSINIINQMGPALLRSVSDKFFSRIALHMQGLTAAMNEEMHKYVEMHALGYSKANSRFYREGFDLLLCTSEDVTPQNTHAAGRKYWPIRVLRSGGIQAKDLPIFSRLREAEALSLLNLPSIYWDSLDFKEWHQNQTV